MALLSPSFHQEEEKNEEARREYFAFKAAKGINTIVLSERSLEADSP